MSNVRNAGIKVGTICALIVLANSFLVIFEWTCLPREQSGLFILLYSAVNLLAFIIAGILSGVYAANYVVDAKESFKPGLVAGMVMAVLPAALACLLIIAGALGGLGQLVWAIAGLGMFFLVIVEIFVSALLSAVYIIVARRSTITIKFG